MYTQGEIYRVHFYFVQGKSDEEEKEKKKKKKRKGWGWLTEEGWVSQISLLIFFLVWGWVGERMAMIILSFTNHPLSAQHPGAMLLIQLISLITAVEDTVSARVCFLINLMHTTVLGAFCGWLVGIHQLKPWGSPHVGWEGNVCNHFPTPVCSVVHCGSCTPTLEILVMEFVMSEDYYS